MMAFNDELISILRRIDELESKQAFQEIIIEDLNKVVVQQQADLAKLLVAIKQLNEKLQASQITLTMPASNESPPHY